MVTNPPLDDDAIINLLYIYIMLGLNGDSIINSLNCYKTNHPELYYIAGHHAVEIRRCVGYAFFFISGRINYPPHGITIFFNLLL